jgi:two-component system, sensor histidine kinase and response regulator
MDNEKVTILIVDDKEANIYALEKLLEKPGRLFLKAMDGKTGLKLALDNNVDLILLDVQMPEMDGFEVAQILKSNKRTKDIPIIFASAEKKERSSVMKGFEEGAVDYLSKPLDPELTKAKVSVLLQIQVQKKLLVEKNISLEKAEAKIKLLNESLQQNLQQIEATNKELESFSYSVSHDLRAPLRSILGYTQVLEEDYIDKLGTDAKQVLNIVRQNAERMNALIDDLLEFARLGKQALQKSEVDTEKLVAHTLQQISASTRHKAEVKINPLIPVCADYSLLNQVWVNLISNAIKYSARKEKPVVEIGSRKEASEVVFYVKDNGAGFDMEYVDKLFGVFQRLHRADEFEGTGVGLALVQRIVNRHGGRVWAEGKVSEGATFYFSLPDVVE